MAEGFASAHPQSGRVPLARRLERPLAHVPFTRANRSRLRRTAARFVGNRAFWFRQVEALPPETRRELLPEVRRSMKRLAPAWLALQESARLARAAGIVALPIGLILGASAAAGRVQPDLDVGGWVAAIVVWAVASVLLGAAAFAPYRTGVEWLGHRGRKVWLIAAGLLAGAAAAALDLGDVRHGSGVGFVLLGATTAVFLVTALVIAIDFVGRTAGYVSWRYAMLTAAHSLVIDSLIAATVDVERYAARNRNKPAIMRSLETAALVVERTLPRGIPSGDAATDAWIRDHARAVAAALRAEKRAVFGLREAGDPMLAWRLARALEHMVRREYGRLERIEPGTTERPARRRIASFAGTLLVAASPLAGVVAVGQTSDALEGPLGGTLLTVSIAWAAVTLLSRYDPLFGSKLAALKDASGLLRPPKP